MRDLASLTDDEVLQLVGDWLSGHPALADLAELARRAGLDPTGAAEVAAGRRPEPMQALRLLLALEDGSGRPRRIADDQEVLLALVEGMGGVGPASRILMAHARAELGEGDDPAGWPPVVCVPGSKA